MVVTARDENRVQFQVSIPADLREAAKQAARHEGMLLYRWVEKVLREAVKGESEMANELTVEEVYARLTDVENAEITDRLLPEPLDGVEYSAHAILDGKPVEVCWYFSAGEVTASEIANEHNPPEALPWDARHVVWIADADGVYIASRGFYAFQF